MNIQDLNAQLATLNSRVTAANLNSLATDTGTGSVGSYALATGRGAVRRLHLLHKIYGPAGRRILFRAGLREGMHVGDFGCGVGVVTRMLAEIVGPSGSVVGIDVDQAQLREAAEWCAQAGPRNWSFVTASAEDTGLPRDSFDLVYCRFLLLHLPDPVSCLLEMHDVLKPGGVLVVEDGDLRSAGSIPPSAHNEFANLFGRFGRVRGLDYSLANNLYHMVKEAGFLDAKLEIHQPALLEEDDRHFLEWSLAEAAEAFVNAGLTSFEQVQDTLLYMQQAIEDQDVLILAPRMSLIWARKPVL